MELPEIRPEERTPLVEELLDIIRQLLDRVCELEERDQKQRDEIAVLKGEKPRPQIKPSQLESPPPKPQDQKGKRPGSAKRSKTAELRIDREVTLHPESLPEGAVFRGYEPYVVQELIIQTENTRYQRARYELPGGGSVLAPFPEGVLPVEGGHFGANLVAYILEQYHHAQVTQPLLLQQLRDFGIDISAGQLNRILTENKELFHQEKQEILVTGLLESSYIGADDTGARHQGKNGYCTVISNDLFACFESTDSKSRINFLQVLQGNERSYVINEMALEYCKQQKLAAAVLDKLNQEPLAFASEADWQTRLSELAISDERHIRIATEGALLGGLVARGVTPDLRVLSDGAGQFVIFVHAACWIHAERPLVKMVPYNEEHRQVIESIRQQIWELYKDLKAYRQQPDEEQRKQLEARFDAMVDQRTAYPSINTVLKHIREHRADLLRVLDYPEVPLHNNGCESDIREYAKRRKVSGGTRGNEGRRCRDTFASLKKTCRKLGVNFWNYLQDRVRGLGRIPRLADLLRAKARPETPASEAEAVPAR